MDRPLCPRRLAPALLAAAMLLPACRPGPRPATDPAARVLLSGPILGPDGTLLCAAFPTARVRVLAEDSAGRPVESSESRCPTDNFFLVVPPGTYTLRVVGAPAPLSEQQVVARGLDASRDMELVVRVGE